MSRDRRAAVIASMAAMAIAATVLVGWLFELERLTRLVPGQVTMKFNAAACLVILGSSLLVRRQRPVLVLSGVVAILAALTILEVAFDRDFGIDIKGRMPGSTALCLVVLALAGAAAVLRRRHLAQALAAVALVVSSVALLGYLYGVDSLYEAGPYSTMAPHTALALLLLTLATLASVEDGVVAWVLTGTDAGAILQRRLYPVALLVLPALGASRLVAERSNFYNARFGLALNITVASAIVTAVTIRAAITLRRLDDDRRRAADELRTLNADLARLVDERSEDLEHERTLVAVLQDRNRIARDLHDRVIQRIFGAGLILGSAQAGPVEAAQDKIGDAINELDSAIRELRQTIFELGAGVDADTASALSMTVGRIARILGFEPTVTINGDLDRIAPDVANHLVAVLHEALSNVARHAHATRASVTLTIDDDAISMVVSDDGSGVPTGSTRSSGTANIKGRAAQLGGTAQWSAGRPGTVLTIRVPLTAP